MFAQNELVIMHDNDNIAIAKIALKKGAILKILDEKHNFSVEFRDDIDFGFKFALNDIPKGGIVYKYGEPMGIASVPIKRGSLVHVHNVQGTRGRGDIST